MEHKQALEMAEMLVDELRPACTRIEIAGSIRRGKPQVKDIEIVAIPDLTPLPRPRLEFGKPIPKVHKTKLDALLFEMQMDGKVEFEKNGDKFKKLVLFDGNVVVPIKVDLFLVTPPATWGVQMAIRTGPADFSHWIVTRKRHGGALPNGYHVQDGAVWAGESQSQISERVGFDSELDFLDFLGLGWIEPGQRVEKWTR